MSVTYTASGTGPDGAEAGKAVISISGNTMTVTLTSLTPDAASDGQNLSSLEFLFAAAPPSVSSLSATGQLIKVNADGTWSNVTGAITHWGTAVSGNNLFLATAGTGSVGGTPDQLITDTAGGFADANKSYASHTPQIADSATFTLTFSGPPPTITGVKFGFGTSPGDATHPLLTGVVCFLEGTRIAVSDTEWANVETLSPGDLVLTSDGRQAPVLWVGRQTVSRLFADPMRTLPVRVGAGALEEGLPARDLLVSPCHALLVDGLLVQAGALVNGVSITRERDVPDTFVYYHLELEDHALILAEGVAAETFVDNVGRMAFDNWAEHQLMFPDGRAVDEMAYPRVTSARQAPASMKRRLAERANLLHGSLSQVA